ncbi:hypothetical protein NFI96_027693 [Prochilodus magdalenae]|nr:hypothetical protein NFI96_027693 [Prochilodus magdalenae]
MEENNEEETLRVHRSCSTTKKPYLQDHGPGPGFSIALPRQSVVKGAPGISQLNFTGSPPSVSSYRSSVTAQNGAVAVAPHVNNCSIKSMNIMVYGHSAAVNGEQTQQMPAEVSKIENVTKELKGNLKRKFQMIFEGIAKRGNPSLLNKIYTELYVTEGEREGLNQEHEIWQIDTMFKTCPEKDIPINCKDIFSPLSNQDEDMANERAEQTQPRTVLTKGIAGIGKTVSVRKFILDWAEGTANQDIDLLLVLPFRELNLIKDEKQSFHELLLDFHPELKEFVEPKWYDKCKILFIFDGLDESQLPLNFGQGRVTDVSRVASLDELVTNLIEGNLLPSALVWITSRPAAIDRIPADRIHRMTEVRGFTDLQKEEYFRKKIKDESITNRIISHVKDSRTLEIMCHIPIFCWITATVLELMLKRGHDKIPSSLTELYTRFLLTQTSVKKDKYSGEAESNPLKLSDADVQLILKLGKLAFSNLQEKNIVFTEEDLMEYGVDVTEVSLRSGVFTEIIKEEDPIFSAKHYSFVHLSFQEYLAAVFVLHAYAENGENTIQSSHNRHITDFFDFLDETHRSGGSGDDIDVPPKVPRRDMTLYDLHKCAVDEALKRAAERGRASIEKIAKYLKSKLREEDDRNVPSSERCINLLHCLLELNDHSIAEEIRRFLTSDRQKELDLKKYNTTREGRRRLIPAVENCRNALVSACRLKEDSAKILGSALLSSECRLKELDLSYNNLTKHGVKFVVQGLQSPYCGVEILRLSGNMIDEDCCTDLASVLRHSFLRELILDKSNIGDVGAERLCSGLSPNCQLQMLGLRECKLSEKACFCLTEVLSSCSVLRELNLGDNDLRDSGVKLLSTGLNHPLCILQNLGLSGCMITEEGCCSLASALKSHPSHLKELDLSYNYPGESGEMLLSAILNDPHCQLETLKLDHAGPSRITAGLQKYYHDLNLGNEQGNLTCSSDRNEVFTFPVPKVTYNDRDDEKNEDLICSPDRKVVTRFQVTDEKEEEPGKWAKVRSREQLNGGRFYWELELTGMVSIGVTDKGLFMAKSLVQNCQKYQCKCPYFATHADQCPIKSSSEVTVAKPERIGVLLDWAAGNLSFYSIYPRGASHLYTFHTKFTNLMYPQFGQERDKILSFIVEKERHESTESVCRYKLCTLLDEDLQKVKDKFKENMKKKFETILEGIARRSNMTLREWIHPQLYISEEESNTDTENENWRSDEDKAISCNNLFTALPGQNKPSVVLSKGITGIGKTVCVQKFVLDWAMGTANQDVDFMFVLPFSELNFLKDEEHSLHTLLCHFYPELKDLHPKMYEQCTVVFILDGLNESKLDLDLNSEGIENSESEENSNPEEKTVTSVDTLISNLITRELAPSAFIWITSRPAEAKHLSKCAHRVTELQGFSDAQKMEYFRKKIHDGDQAKRIISHIETTWTLNTMCDEPVFCWITATALESWYNDFKSAELPKILTEILTWYLIQRRQMTGRLSDDDVELLCALGEMAFKFPRDDCVLTDNDLREYGIEPEEQPKQSELLSHVFLEVSPSSSTLKSYRFLHSSVQAYLAALHVLRSHSYGIAVLKTCRAVVWFPKDEEASDIDSSQNESQETWTRKEDQGTLWELLRDAVDNSLVNVELQLDANISSDMLLKHFLSFLLGLTLNAGEMGQLIGEIKQDLDSIQKVIRYIKYILKTETKKNLFNHDKCISLLCCLGELKDYSFEEEMRMFILSCGTTERQLTIAQCSVLAHLVQVSGTVLDDLDVLRLCPLYKGQCRLVSVLKNCRKARVRPQQAKTVISALLSSNSHLEKLEFSHGCLVDYKLLAEALKEPMFRLKELHFTHIDRDISKNNPSLNPELVSWVEVIRAVLLGPHAQPHSFTLKDCSLDDDSCEVLASALQSTNMGLKKLDLSSNHMTDTGVQNIYQKLERSKCDLEKLKLSYCNKITGKSCTTLAKVLHRSHLKELHLNGCRIGDSGIKLLSGGMTRPNQLQILCCVTFEGPVSRLGLCNLTGDSCKALASVLCSDPSALRELDLSNNDLEDSGVKLLSAGLKSPYCKLESLRMSGCMITEEGCSFLASALKSNPFHLRELDLSYNHPGESGEKMLFASVENPNFKLETLNLVNGGEHRMQPGFRKYGSYFEKWELKCQEDVKEWERHIMDCGYCGEQEKFYWQVEGWTGTDFGMKYKSPNHQCFSFDQSYCEMPVRQSCKEPLNIMGFYNSFIAYTTMPQKVGMYLDWPAGTLSFYNLTPELTHLYTLYHRFTKPLYPYVKLNEMGKAVSVQSLGCEFNYPLITKV